MDGSMTASFAAGIGFVPLETAPGRIVCARWPDDAVAREEAVVELCARLAETEPGAFPREVPVKLATAAQGCPVLVVGGTERRWVSFSRSSGTTWGAVAVADGIGIDASADADFDSRFPLARVFGSEELRWAEEACGSRSSAAALLWSAKEAAVKALGTGFRTTEPREVVVSAPRRAGRELVLEVRAAGSPLPAWCRRHPGGWLSAALVE